MKNKFKIILVFLIFLLVLIGVVAEELTKIEDPSKYGLGDWAKNKYISSDGKWIADDEKGSNKRELIGARTDDKIVPPPSGEITTEPTIKTVIDRRTGTEYKYKVLNGQIIEIQDVPIPKGVTPNMERYDPTKKNIIPVGAYDTVEIKDKTHYIMYQKDKDGKIQSTTNIVTNDKGETLYSIKIDYGKEEGIKDDKVTYTNSKGNKITISGEVYTTYSNNLNADQMDALFRAMADQGVSNLEQNYVTGEIKIGDKTYTFEGGNVVVTSKDYKATYYATPKDGVYKIEEKGKGNDLVISSYNANGNMIERVHYDDKGSRYVTNWDTKGNLISTSYGNFKLEWDNNAKMYKGSDGNYYDKDGNLLEKNEKGELVKAEDQSKVDPDAKKAAEGAKKNQRAKNAYDAGGEWAYISKWFGQFLDEWTYITSGYRGLSMFYTEPDWWLFYDETMMNILGGIDGWSSLVCRSKISDALDYGITMSPSTSGAFAHIEGEKIKVINYSAETPDTYYLYKISLEVNPGSKSGGCDMEFKVYIQEPRRSVFRNSETGSDYTFKLEKGNESISYKGANMIFKQSKNDYNKLCIHFDKLTGGCLAGVKGGEDFCNNIVDGGEKKISLGEDPCDKFPTMIMPNCWFTGTEEEKEEEPSPKEGATDVGDW